MKFIPHTKDVWAFFLLVVNLTSRVLNSSGGSTAEWNSTYTKTKNAITKVLKKFGATDIKFNKGHFSMSGFFTKIIMEVLTII